MLICHAFYSPPGPVCSRNLCARWEVESADCDKRNGKEVQAASQVDGPDAQVWNICMQSSCLLPVLWNHTNNKGVWFNSTPFFASGAGLSTFYCYITLRFENVSLLNLKDLSNPNIQLILVLHGLIVQDRLWMLKWPPLLKHCFSPSNYFHLCTFTICINVSSQSASVTSCIHYELVAFKWKWKNILR